MDKGPARPYLRCVRVVRVVIRLISIGIAGGLAAWRVVLLCRKSCALTHARWAAHLPGCICSACRVANANADIKSAQAWLLAPFSMYNLCHM